VNEDPPRKLEYADPQLPRPGLPPDGYFGYRAPKVGPSWDVVLFAVLAFVGCIALLFWIIGRWLAGMGA
jgi:hypothetical protein